MKREFLEGLKIEGLTKEVIDSIMAEHGKEVQSEQTKTTAKESELTTANKTIKGLQETVKKFDGKDPDKLQADLDALDIKYKADIATEKKKNSDTVKSFALKEQLAKSGVLDPDYMIYKAGGIEKFTFTDEDKPIGVDDVLKPYKEDKAMAHLFKESNHYNPNKGGNGGGLENPFAKETFNMTKQGEILKSNPEQARLMAAEAGVKL